MHTMNPPQTLAALAARIGLDASFAPGTGRLNLQTDSFSRVSLSVGAAGRIEAEIPIASLCGNPALDDALLNRLMLHVTANAAVQCAAVALAADGERLLLQAVLDEHDCAGAFEDFLDSADNWALLLKAMP